MSRRLATCFRMLVPVSLAAIALTGCSGGKSESSAPQPVAAATPAAEPPPPAPAPSPTPATAAPVEAPPVAAAGTTPAPRPETTAGSSAETGTPPSPAAEKSPTPKPQPPDALQVMKDSEARRYDYARRLDDAKSNLEAADLSMVTWEKNVLAFKNPFLARPQLSPEDSQAIAAMNGAERVRWAEERLAEVSTKRAVAQKTLDDLKANPPVN